jgi:hypothetical protein
MNGAVRGDAIELVHTNFNAPYIINVLFYAGAVPEGLFPI